jgi:hypothetical protein
LRAGRNRMVGDNRKKKFKSTTANDELLQLAVLGVPFASIMQVNCQPERV